MSEIIDNILAKLERPMSHYCYAVVNGKHHGRVYMVRYVEVGGGAEKVFDGPMNKAEAVKAELSGILRTTQRFKSARTNAQ